jgi:hypothetical protein
MFDAEGHRLERKKESCRRHLFATWRREVHLVGRSHWLIWYEHPAGLYVKDAHRVQTAWTIDRLGGR